jgi:steroid delta-isomerase-like uncharacterized protein
MCASARSDLKQLLTSFVQAKNRQDVSGIVALCHPDGSYESIGFPGRVQGREALARFYAQLFELLPDYHGEFDGYAISQDAVVAWGRFCGTIAGAAFGPDALGRRIDVPVTFVCEVRAGLIYRDTGYFDAATVYRQAGLPVPPLDMYPRAASFVRRFANHWAERQPEEFRDLLHPETRNFYPGMNEAQGPDGIVDWLANAVQTFPDIALRVTRWAVDREAVLIELEGSATINGRKLTWGAADRFTLTDDRCIEGRSYFDTRPLAEALQATGGSDD